jgi:alpha-L-fucosidase
MSYSFVLVFCNHSCRRLRRESRHWWYWDIFRPMLWILYLPVRRHTMWSFRNNLARHELPRWFDDAKFGIFIHWGPYSVPAWGNSTTYESYAEWFWWYPTHPEGDKSGFHDYRLRTFGPELNYDNFFANFRAAKYEPKDWVDLIADAGAKYFVITTKHHDGFALFDAGNTTNRTSLHYGPKQDVVKSLFEAAKIYQPALKRGTYFSLPEWFNPSFGPYGFAQYDDRPDGTTHPGIIARNPYTRLSHTLDGYPSMTSSPTLWSPRWTF